LPGCACFPVKHRTGAAGLFFTKRASGSDGRGAAEKEPGGPRALREIVAAIRRHDPDAAERACRDHVQRAHDIARRQLQDAGGTGPRSGSAPINPQPETR